MKLHLQWAVAVVRVLRLLPTLPLFSHLWAAYLQRLAQEEEHDLVSWLRSYERELPFLLKEKYVDSSPPPTYVSFWSGLEGTVPGSGSGNQPAEALHAPWQRELSALGGKGGVGHVLAVMENLYQKHWHDWYGWASDAPVTFSTDASWLNIK